MTSETRSKVMSLGNRLTPKMHGDKSAAFCKAWAIVKAYGLEIAVKGVSFGNKQEALKRLAAYSPGQIRAVLVPEPTNPKDSTAIAVRVGVQNGKGLFTVGYVPKEMTAVINAIGGKLPAFRVVSGTWGYASRTTYGARIQLAV
ncbi:MAG: HIRAN domain-containing protein [Treponema sp.]|nr:HIRAN domain-containing protein [Treponema sp.]MCL2186812.1 HIRAN domain-containing protein [Treponema sp.]